MLSYNIAVLGVSGDTNTGEAGVPRLANKVSC